VRERTLQWFTTTLGQGIKMITTTNGTMLKSSTGIGAITLLTFVIVGNLIGITVTIVSLIARFNAQDFIGIVVLSVLIAFCIRQLSLKIQVSLTVIEIKSLWNSVSFDIADINSLNVIHTTYGFWILSIKFKSSEKPVAISTMMMANQNALDKTIIEASYLHNPQVHIDDQIIRKYGRPPYGVFVINQE
jgi:hypothetical protein